MTNRENLSAVIVARDTLRGGLEDISRSLNRLTEAQTAPAAPGAELAALDAEETAAALAWSRSGSGEPPAPDVERRALIEARLARAKAAASAAERAVGPLTTEFTALAHRLADAEKDVKLATLAVAVDEVAAHSEELRAATAALARVTCRIEAGRQAIVIGCHALAGTDNQHMTRQIFADLEKLAGALRDASPHVLEIQDAQVAEGARYANLLQRLSTDAAATLAA